MKNKTDVTLGDYQALAEFRFQIRRYLTLSTPVNDELRQISCHDVFGSIQLASQVP